MHNVEGVVLGFDSDKANCKGQDTYLFFPTHSKKNGGFYQSQRLAIKYCENCQVKEPCLEYSLHYEPMGVWGGKTEVEREVIRQKRQIKLPENRVHSDSVRRALRSGSIRRQMRLESSEII